MALFAEVVGYGAAAGADLVVIETMGDSYELKAAVLAAKENSELPVIATAAFDERARLLTGGTPEAVTALLEGLRVDALGLNCGLGPREMLPIAERFAAAASLPVAAAPNAGLPRSVEGRTVFDLSPGDFAEGMAGIAGAGAQLLGGCCGTTPEHIAALVERCRELPFAEPVRKRRTVVSSFSTAVELGAGPVIVGERINPTGKPRLKEALRAGNMDYLLSEGAAQEDAGAQILDVNVGLPGVDEPAMLERAVTALQGVTGLPLQLDSSDAPGARAGHAALQRQADDKLRQRQGGEHGGGVPAHTEIRRHGRGSRARRGRHTGDAGGPRRVRGAHIRDGGGLRPSRARTWSLTR